jgi:AICAR transformylase/IMP cyclohydrolase PurH
MLQIDLPPGGDTAWEQGRNLMDVKRVGSGLLMQTADNHELAIGDLKVVTQEAAHAGAAAGPAVRLEGRQVRQVQRHRVLQGRHDAWASAPAR